MWPGELVAGDTESRCHTAVCFHSLSSEHSEPTALASEQAQTLVTGLSN